MDSRQAYKITLKHMIVFLIEDGKISEMSGEIIDSLVEGMHDDMFFIDEFADFLKYFIEENSDRYLED
jgi:hypothetical protein